METVTHRTWFGISTCRAMYVSVRVMLNFNVIISEDAVPKNACGRVTGNNYIISLGLRGYPCDGFIYLSIPVSYGYGLLFKFVRVFLGCEGTFVLV